MSEAIDQILDLGFLGAIAREDLLSLRPKPDLLSVKTGETLIWQGEVGQAYYLLLRGRLRRFVYDRNGSRSFVGDVIPGQGVGASGLLTDAGNAATVRVMHDSEVVRFPRASFLQMMVHSWEFAIGVSREQIDRVRAAVSPEGGHATIKTIAVVPMDPTVDGSRFVNQLCSAVEPIASVTAIDETVMDPQADAGPSARRAAQPSLGSETHLHTVINQLEIVERTHDIVLYRISPDVDAWTRLILGRADLVLLVAPVGGRPDPRRIETALIEPTEDDLLPRIDLVLIHDGEWHADCRTRDWLDVRRVDEWHHLRAGREEDFQRLARMLTGNAVTLVLGGGGARGLSEIGVYKALREAGIPIDRFAGTSMGATIGGLLATGEKPDTIAERLRIWAKKGTPGKDYTFPALSLVHGKKLHKATNELFGDRNIEDLPIPFLCISSDLSENKALVHDRGSLWRSARASMSVPGVGPPLFDDGRILADGGLVNNVPADVVADRYSGRIIVVDVSMQRKLAVPESYNDLVPSGWRILWHRINPFLEPLQVPGILDILARATGIGGSNSYRRARELADITIIPPVSRVGLLDFHEMDRMIDIGYNHTRTQLMAIGQAALQDLFPGMGIVELNAALGPAASSPIDRAQFNEILGVDDDDTFREMIGVFVDMFPAEIDGLASAVGAAENNQIRELAHRAKSAAANIAAPALTALLFAIETGARKSELEVVPDYVERARAEFARIRAYYEQI